MDQLDPAYMAIIRYQRMEYDECIEVCTAILEKNPYDEAIWSLKTRALTAQVVQIHIKTQSCSAKKNPSLFVE